MRLIGLLLALILLGYAMKAYLDAAVAPPGEQGPALSRPQATLERAEQATQRINRSMEERQRRLEASGH